MTRHVLQTSPTTVIFTSENGETLWVAERVSIESVDTPGDNSPPYVLTLEGRSDSKIWPVSDVNVISENEWLGVLYSDDLDDPGTGTFYVRGTTPRDAEWAINLDGYPSIPLPINVIRSSISSGGSTMAVTPELYAVLDDDSFVGTILLSAESGLYVRYSNQWHEVSDPNLIEDKTIQMVSESAVGVFDEAEQGGSVLPISEYLVSGSRAPNSIDETPEDSDEDEDAENSAITASTAVTLLPPKLSSAEDVPAAIAAAVENTVLQWWVERRLSALEIEADLPWKR